METLGTRIPNLILVHYLLAIETEFNAIHDYAKDGGEELFTKMRSIIESL